MAGTALIPTASKSTRRFAKYARERRYLGFVCAFVPSVRQCSRMGHVVTAIRGNRPGNRMAGAIEAILHQRKGEAMTENAEVNPKARFDVPWAVYAVVKFKGEHGRVVGCFSNLSIAEKAIKDHRLQLDACYEVFKYVRDNTFTQEASNGRIH